MLWGSICRFCCMILLERVWVHVEWTLKIFGCLWVRWAKMIRYVNRWAVFNWATDNWTIVMWTVQQLGHCQLCQNRLKFFLVVFPSYSRRIIFVFSSYSFRTPIVFSLYSSWKLVIPIPSCSWFKWWFCIHNFVLYGTVFKVHIWKYEIRVDGETIRSRFPFWWFCIVWISFYYIHIYVLMNISVYSVNAKIESWKIFTRRPRENWMDVQANEKWLRLRNRVNNKSKLWLQVSIVGPVSGFRDVWKRETVDYKKKGTIEQGEELGVEIRDFQTFQPKYIAYSICMTFC